MSINEKLLLRILFLNAFALFLNVTMAYENDYD